MFNRSVLKQFAVLAACAGRKQGALGARPAGSARWLRGRFPPSSRAARRWAVADTRHDRRHPGFRPAPDRPRNLAAG